jgi:hypothetical protein
MSNYAGPSIPKSGLICLLDAANPKSYPGSGTTWYDISGNGNNGTLINGPTFSQNTILLDGVNDYIQLNSPNLRTGNYTVIGASRRLSGSGRTFSGLLSNWLMGHWSGYTENYYRGTDGLLYNGTNDTNWRIYSATRSSSNFSFYSNNIGIVIDSTAGTDGPEGFAIGSYSGTSEYGNANISYMVLYNRQLTSSEISQSFYAFRGRYGV